MSNETNETKIYHIHKNMHKLSKESASNTLLTKF